MKWFYCDSVEELKKLGSFKEVRKQVKKGVGDNIKIKANSWDNLFKSISSFKELFKEIEFPNRKDDYQDLYFKSQISKTIFYLLELDGEDRLEKLGINRLHYIEKEKADEWRKKLIKKVHPDICNHPKAQEAFIKVNYLYKEMIGNER